MGRVEGMVSENAKVLLNRAIEACLSQGSIKRQLDEVSACFQQLKAYRDEIPDEMDHVWTAPTAQGISVAEVRSVGCRHVSGLFDAARMAAGPDAIRGLGPYQLRGL